MYYVLIAILIIFLVDLVFCFGPALVIFLAVFRHGKSITLADVNNIDDTYYGPYKEELFKVYDSLLSRPQEEVYVESFDKAKLTGVFFDNNSEKTALCLPGFHGNLSNNFIMQVDYLLQLGFNVLCVTERAHDNSGGKWSGLGLLEKEDVLYWIDYIKNVKKSKECLVWGVSMGGAIAGYASDRLDKSFVKAMVIDCGFNSPEGQIIKDCKMHHVPWWLIIRYMKLLAKVFIKIDITENVEAHISNTDIPVFFIHGKDDMSVPFDNGLRNYEACSSYKECFWVDNCPHIIGFIVGDNKLREQLTVFLKKYF